MNTAAETLYHWRPMFWEPVAGTGERLMVGLVYVTDDGQVSSVRIIRDDVLDCLYGQKSSPAIRNLLGAAFEAAESVTRAAGVEALNIPVYGVHPGDVRHVPAASENELARTAALMFSSLANLDKFDDLDEFDAPPQEEVNRRFGTEVRDIVTECRPELANGFGRGGTLIDGGAVVKFGYFSAKAIVHFSVLSPVRQSASVRDARARLWELDRARGLANVNQAALITAVPHPDDATLGSKQRQQLKANQHEIEREADEQSIRVFPVTTARQGAEQLIAFVG